MFTLYYSPGSCSLAPRIILEDIGKPYELKLVSVAKGEQTTPAFLAVNPRGRLPVLVENGRVLVENLAILMHLAASSPASQLLPDDSGAQAQCLAVMAWFSSTVQPGFSRFFRPERISADDTAHAGIKALAKDFCWNNLLEIEALLSRQEWFAGERYSISDPYGLIYYAWGKRIGLPLKELASYTRFKNKMLDRQNVRTVLQDERSILLDPG
jgi:glutathione S-transferase